MFAFFFFFFAWVGQERDRAVSPSIETRVLCDTVHEGHPDRPAYDLHASHCIHGQLYEKVGMDGLKTGV